MAKNKGWPHESARHSLAAKGIKTGRKAKIPKRVSKGIVIDTLKKAGIPYVTPTATGIGAKVQHHGGTISVYWAGLKDVEKMRERLEEVRAALKKAGIKTSWTFADAGDYKIPYLSVDTISIFVEEA